MNTNHQFQSNNTPFSECITCRILLPSDASSYKDIRTEALSGDDRRFFTADPDKEFAYTLDDWKRVCTETYNHAVIGAFIRNKLVGVMTADRSPDDMTGLTSYYCSEYVRPAFRHMGIARQMLMTRDGWALNNDFDKARFTIRTDNEWLNRQVRHGAKIVKELQMPFADGSVAPIYLLERDLVPDELRYTSAVA